ncbi:MAG: hypothetical protein DWQ44_00115 [Bacteroidetes bacterium]|nr:MAG: hypothetical protein DWQ33_05065 [Bacteroidota bacterium]REK06034.1 MAG: hypothetical protein DWQ39_04205 [Bacteroidota bacterium]REK37092.1 MAG: hypothetical protein DWQ44_00115 [Bacteroidota bacterium]REK47515.1 MAG: hypothetical protein DWQ48_12330 [Bacteroidota bacterium]
MELVKSNIRKIEFLGKDMFKVSVNVCDLSSAAGHQRYTDYGYAGREGEDDNYDFILNEKELIPVGDTLDCMKIYNDYDYSEEMSAELRKLWLTASIIDDVACQLISGNLLRLYSPEQD